MGALAKAGLRAAGLAAYGFGATCSVLRGGRRAFHPAGCCFRATLHVHGHEPLAGGLLPAGRHHAYLRLSRGAGLPERWPDILGLALRVELGPDRRLDLLFNSSADGRVGKYLMIPARRFYERTYSTILGYDVYDRHILVGLVPPEGDRGPSLTELRRSWNLDGAVFGVVVAPRDGDWRPAGRLVVGDPYPEGEETLVFDPWNVPEPARPGGFFNALRKSAYPGAESVQEVLGPRRRARVRRAGPTRASFRR